ncbi:MAG: CotH kinase family protein, partial [Acholeplasmataceae bacterium]|nr:CotH kinase family protein [Acholeplasmataceae bacterium]
LLTNDYDNNFSSTFVYKDQGGKLVFGPPWDFDLSYGNHTLNPSTSTINMYHLLYALGELPWFKTLLIERWNNINTDNGLINQMKDQIHEYTETYTHYFESNHVMWQNTRTTGGWHFYAQSGIHSQADGATHFYNWLVERIAFIDTYLT